MGAMRRKCAFLFLPPPNRPTDGRSSFPDAPLPLFPFPFSPHPARGKIRSLPPPLLRSFAWAAPRPHTCLDFFSPFSSPLKYHRRSQGVVAIQGGGASLSRVWGVFNDVPGAKKEGGMCARAQQGRGGGLLQVEHMTGKDPEEEEEERLRFLECQSTPSW